MCETPATSLLFGKWNKVMKHSILEKKYYKKWKTKTGLEKNTIKNEKLKQK